LHPLLFVGGFRHVSFRAMAAGLNGSIAASITTLSALMLKVRKGAKGKGWEVRRRGRGGRFGGGWERGEEGHGHGAQRFYCCLHHHAAGSHAEGRRRQGGMGKRGRVKRR
jgi:hypothetical protein